MDSNSLKQSHKNEFAMATFLNQRYLGNFFKDPRTIIWGKKALKRHLKYFSLGRTYPLLTFFTETCWNTKSYVGILNSSIGIGIGIGDFLASASVSVSVSVFGYRSYTILMAYKISPFLSNWKKNTTISILVEANVGTFLWRIKSVPLAQIGCKTQPFNVVSR